MKIYHDRNGKRIRAGMKIRDIDNGDIEYVHEAIDGDLGLNATNWASPAAYKQELYPLSNFNMDEWEIVEDK